MKNNIYNRPSLMALVPPALGPESNQHREEGLQGCGWSNIRKAHTQLGKSPIPKDPSGNDLSGY